MTRYVIPLSDYNRVHQVAHGVSRAFGGSEKGCIFFACVGALILTKQYRIKCSAVAGAFAFCANDTPEMAFFGESQGSTILSSEDGFHMWVQTETHIIDFMAPIFPEAFADKGLTVPRKMFQRPLSTEAASLDAMAAPGDFYAMPNLELTDRLLDRFLSRPSSGDLLQVAETWFGHRRKPQVKTLEMGDSAGDRYTLTIPDTVARSAW